jgi:hypothetical protein
LAFHDFVKFLSMADSYFFLFYKTLKMVNQNMRVLPIIMMEKKFEVNIFDYFLILLN